MSKAKQSLVSFQNSDENFTILATTPTGFEKIALDEIKQKVPVVSHDLTMGRIFFQTTRECMSTLHTLKSVDNLYIIIKYIPDYVYHEDKEQALDDLLKMPSTIPWSEVVKFWRLNQLYCKKKKNKNFKKIKPDPVQTEKEGEVNSCGKVIENEKEPVNPDHADISFRVSATRVGKKQSIISPEAERVFGGALNDHTQWKVDLSNYNFEVNLILGVDSFIVSTALTNSSLHRRNITHFGITTLRGTIAYNMARLCEIKAGDVVIDPMCGSGSISIEAATEWKNSFQIAGDNAHPAIVRTNCNVKYLNSSCVNLTVDVMHWDVTNLPLKSNSVDVLVTDMPFGKRVGSQTDNKTLYPETLKELARVARVGSARACFLTRDKRNMNNALVSLKSFWKTKETFYINIGGLKAVIYLLTRSNQDFISPVVKE